ncbi:hypothetical protein CAI21_19950 [Alkalilimnicola ehrlichii]|uniref:Polysaccharide biosynthesis protein n=1 Tax=Alkalilimnicola ehrlichii TaxID=351052 RepID=A0A3E0WGM7_9GAMM|nr:CpsD/CapB family tyrosine-protein kinase [Alkalilimnicola ehrlichii]RFA25167.1 hypothetical protein CAI21_19950 [Alkalilimnicola ehrlichii]RFA32122.1 hypothetical protein CAL65_20535 [Alkalilimnicola ehrlichii]
MSKIEEALRRARSERAQSAADKSGYGPRHTVPARPTSPAQSKQLVGLSAAEEIAHMRETQARTPDELAKLRIIHSESEDPRACDAFRHIRTALLQRSAGRNFVLVVTSVAGNGGASFVALNLAASFALDDSKTALLIDGNLREPRHNALLAGADQCAGLTDFLVGDEDKVENIIHPVGIPRLRLIAAGQRGRAAMEYFTTPQLGRLLNELKQRYRERFIIIDTPPIMEAADARILSELCDFTLLVVPYGKVTNAQISAAADTVGQEKLVGCVMNNECVLPRWQEGDDAGAE